MSSSPATAELSPNDPIAFQPSSGRSDGRLPLVPADRLRDSPSRADGISAQEETRLRSTACSFIARAGKELQFKQLAIATACVYFHTFFVRFSFKGYDRFEIAAVCLFLAGKVEEQRRKVKDVAEICLMVRNGRRRGVTDPNVLKTVCDSILDRELLLLSVVEFQFHPAHPYQYCMMVLKQMFQSMDEEEARRSQTSGESLSKLVQKEIAQYAWLMINDSLKTTLCLQYKPEPIALGCIDAAFRIINLGRDKPIKLRPDWFTDYVASATPDQCLHIWSVLLEVIELESAGHTGDSQVLWEKFRKVVSSANSNEGLVQDRNDRRPEALGGTKDDHLLRSEEDASSAADKSQIESFGAESGAVGKSDELASDLVRTHSPSATAKASPPEPMPKKIRTA